MQVLKDNTTYQLHLCLFAIDLTKLLIMQWGSCSSFLFSNSLPGLHGVKTQFHVVAKEEACLGARIL